MRDPDTTTYRIAIGPVLQAKIAGGDPYWHEFNASFENTESTQLDVADAIYTGRPVTTWHKDHWRKTENYLCGQHLGLDFDTGDERSSIPHLLKDPFIGKYASLIYTTLSHRPEAPRSRVMFLLDTAIIQPTNYKLASQAMCWMYGAADSKCTDVVRFWYGGKPGACDVEWLRHELPIQLVKDLIKRYQATGQTERKQQGIRTYAPGSADQAKVVDALKFIGAWSIDYDEWVQVLMALHAEYGDAGLPIAEAWGDGALGEVQRKWRSFKSDGNTTGRVGIGTVFALAQQRGWSKAA